MRAGDAMAWTWGVADPVLKADRDDIPHIQHNAIRVVLRHGGDDAARGTTAPAAVDVEGVHAVLGHHSITDATLDCDVYLLEGDPAAVTRAAREAAPYGAGRATSCSTRRSGSSCRSTTASATRSEPARCRRPSPERFVRKDAHGRRRLPGRSGVPRRGAAPGSSSTPPRSTTAPRRRRGATALRACRSTWTARAPGSAPSTRRDGPASRCRRSTAGGAAPACSRRSSTRSRRSSTCSVGAFSVAVSMVVPTLIAHGTEQQKKEHIDAILRGDELWCQLYSEPGAGSDLASLGTRAVRRRRRVRRQRAEGVEQLRPVRRLRDPARPHRSRRSRSTAASPTSSST